MSRPFENATIGHIGDNLRYHCGKCVVKTGMVGRIHERGYPFCKCDITTAGAFEYFSLYMCVECFIEAKNESEKLRDIRRKDYGPRSYQSAYLNHCDTCSAPLDDFYVTSCAWCTGVVRWQLKSPSESPEESPDPDELPRRRVVRTDSAFSLDSAIEDSDFSLSMRGDMSFRETLAYWKDREKRSRRDIKLMLRSTSGASASAAEEDDYNTSMLSVPTPSTPIAKMEARRDFKIEKCPSALSKIK